MKHDKQKCYGGRCIRGTGFLTRLWRPRNLSDGNLSDIDKCRFSYKQLSLATGAFSQELQIGKGGFGIVYRGVLPTSGISVAVKKLQGRSNYVEKQLMAEVLIMSQLRHRNLLQFLGWCKDRDRYLIVYELMPKGSLDRVLFGLDEEHTLLSWPQRFKIVCSTASVLDYIHQGFRQQVIHRNITSSNILLDDEWNAKLGGFGLACLLDHQKTVLDDAILAGTHGYLALEAFKNNEFTEKTDVYSFGVVALEIVCGRRSFLLDRPEDEKFLVNWVWERRSKGDLLSVIDRRLDDYDAHWMNVVLLMGLVCSHSNPVARPTMRHVVQVLAGDVPVPRVPTSKPSFELPTRIHSRSDSSRSDSSRSDSMPWASFPTSKPSFPTSEPSSDLMTVIHSRSDSMPWDPFPTSKPRPEIMTRIHSGRDSMPCDPFPTSKASTEFMTRIHSGSNSSILMEDSLSLDAGTSSENSTSWSDQWVKF